MKTLIPCIAALAATTAMAADVTIRSGISDWTADASYEGGKAPSSGDNVIVPANTTVTLDATDTASWTLVESLTRIIPQANTSVLTVRVDSASSALLTTPFAIYNKNDFSDYRVRYTGLGELVKVGEGDLEIGGATSRYLNDGRRVEFNTRLTVKEGTLTMPQNVTTGNSPCYGPLTIEKGATVVGLTVHPDYQKSVWPNYAFFSLSGEGTLTSSGPRPFNVNCIHGMGTSVFAGKLSGVVSGYISGDLVLTGTNSDTTGSISTYYNGAWDLSAKGSFAGNWWGGYVSVVKVGKTGEESSLGKAGTFSTGNYGGGIVYLGTGEETDKTFKFADGAGQLWGYGFIDGGATGGLVWSGPWTQYSGSDATKAQQMVMMGSNATACVMSGVIEDFTGNDSVKYPTYLIKKGTGTWRMADNAKRTGGGGYAVENGTLQFESIAEKGTVCSLGTASNLTKAYSGRDIENNRVDYAYLLGTATTEGTMEFVGTNGSQCLTRPMAVKSRGRFKVSGSGRFAFSGISAHEGDATITLDTERTSGVIFGGLHDGEAGKLKVVKDGEGTVTLYTDCDFTGGLEVKSGSLVVEGTGRSVKPYRWFRWIITEKGRFCSRYSYSSDWPNNPSLLMEEFAMFDADGKRIDKNLAYSDRMSGFDQMPAGTVAQETPYSIAQVSGGNNSKITTYFDGGAGSVSGSWGGIDMLASVYPFCRQDTPSQWFKMVVHLADGAKTAASFDLAGFYGASASSGAREVTALRIEGSVDGVNWEPVVEKTALEIPETGCRWYSKPDDASLISKDGSAYYLKDHVGFEMRGTSTNDVAGIASIAAPVSVASGSSLVADGTVTLNSLKLSVAGNGTINGFTLAEQGTLDVTGYTSGNKVELPVTLSGVTGVANLSKWTLTVDGKAKPTKVIDVGSDGKVYVCSTGLMVILE